MDDEDEWDEDDGHFTGKTLDAATLNSSLGVHYHNGRITVLKPGAPDETLETTSIALLSGLRRLPVLALSDGPSNLFALSEGPVIRVYELSSLSIVCTLSGNGRTVTALQWMPQRTTTLVAGCIDGSVALWDVHSAKRPYLRLAAHAGLCSGLSTQPNSTNMIASVHQDQTLIWNLDHTSSRPVARLSAEQKSFGSVAWRPGNSGHLAVCTSDGILKVYDANDAALLKRNGTGLSSSDSEDSDDVGGSVLRPDLHKPREIASLVLSEALSQIQWINSDLLLLLDERNNEAVVLDFNENERMIGHYWSCELPSQTVALHIQYLHGTACIVTIGKRGIESHDLRSDVHNRLVSMPSKEQVASFSLPTSPGVNQTAKGAQKVPSGNEDMGKSFSMTPVPISSQHTSTSSFAKTSRQLQRTRRLSRLSGTAHPSAVEKTSAASQPQSMTSSLELPKPDSEHDSPMPFLSPSIPARRSPQTVIASLDDSIFRLPPLPDSSLDSGHAPPLMPDNDDDDSEDETFVDRLQGSATFLPGGINVPLPKACGALFAPNGQLLTFFPSRPRSAVMEREALPAARTPMRRHQRRSGKIARLFPTFGNLMDDSGASDSDESDSVVSDDFDLDEAEDLFPNFQMPQSSFQSQHSWQARTSPSRNDFRLEPQVQTNINIAVHDLDDAVLPLRIQRLLAHEYRILRDDAGSGAGVCEHNAEVAGSNGLTNNALIWRLIGLLLEDKVPVEALQRAGDDKSVLVVAQTAVSCARIESDLELSTFPKQIDNFGRLRWADDPLGEAWLVRRIFEWAEACADVQHLACFAAVLAEADRKKHGEETNIGQSFYSKFPTYGLDYFTDASLATLPPRTTFQETPVLRARRPTNVVEEKSPPKLHRDSTTISRTSSQLATPHVDPTGTTPPFSLPALSRQGSRLSASGSASPEAHRSSFSAAAKYYAQSISDKFTSYSTYGTSPPTRKTGMSVSPSNNELSSSLPSGSWSKTVSFAAPSATAVTARGSLLSKSFEEQLEDPYDSDKTIEDSSLPHTPKSGTGDVLVRHKNQHAFDDEISGGAKAPFLSDDVARKAQVWVQHYAESLRNWGMMMKATELEKMIAPADTEIGSRVTSHAEDEGVVPMREEDASKIETCAICTTVLRSTEQICLQCLHTSHLDCLADYSVASADEDFTCPAGCGCNCSRLELVMEEVKPALQAARPVYRKKPSFTDPRRWRARIEGDSGPPAFAAELCLVKHFCKSLSAPRPDDEQPRRENLHHAPLASLISYSAPRLPVVDQDDIAASLSQSNTRHDHRSPRHRNTFATLETRQARPEGPPYNGFTSRPPRTKKCVVEACNDPSKDDAPAIRRAFQQCHEDAHVLFENSTYYVHTVLNTTGLRNVDVEVKGTLMWDNSDIDYWRNNSLYIGFQNQTSAWFFGGDQVHCYGHGYGTLNGNGQVWYTYSNGTSNLHGRPHAITISDTTDSVVEGLNFVKSQMWTSTVIRSERVLLQDIYVNNSCEPGVGTFDRCNVNTDGCDTVYANNITFKRWTVDNGDDGIALKQNSTNIYVEDSEFYNGVAGIAFGSIGQYPGQIEVIENFTARNLYNSNTKYAAYLKTWTGLNKGYPPNGGGGGLGHAMNLSCIDFTTNNVSLPWAINQKTSYNGQPGGENTSRFQIGDMHLDNASGTVVGPFEAAFQCSGASPCDSIQISDNSFTTLSNGTAATGVRCSNVVDPMGFNCTADCGSQDELCPS
ncbi:uncharacterized protein LTR77_000232 [Saxophila tyrrhenica]|uniref:RING-type domain-containing protein n=1 Tax=Saxophila tyrrhenica TaxID=1690608 RepID=A0AAV9PNJ3_9PEZI|nr:hypothetical protein LTR77_000232 [Saxophila tyrrhenica]